MGTGNTTTTKRLAELLLGEPIDGWILARRPDTSWRLIAEELREATGGQVHVAPETMRLWGTSAERAA